MTSTTNPAPAHTAKDGKGIVEQDNWAMELQGFIDGGPMRITVDTLPCTAEASKQGGTQFLHCPLMGARLLGQAAEWRRAPPPSLTLTVRARWTQGQADPLTLERQQRVAFTLPTPEA